VGLVHEVFDVMKYVSTVIFRHGCYEVVHDMLCLQACAHHMKNTTFGGMWVWRLYVDSSHQNRGPVFELWSLVPWTSTRESLHAPILRAALMVFQLFG
jgi:hypothetical protein